MLSNKVCKRRVGSTLETTEGRYEQFPKPHPLSQVCEQSRHLDISFLSCGFVVIIIPHASKTFSKNGKGEGVTFGMSPRCSVLVLTGVIKFLFDC